MNANWQSVLAGISNGLMSVSVLPGRRKVLPVFLVALLPALLMAVIVVIPQCYQLRETGQRIVVLEGALDSPSQLLAAHPIGFEDAWQQVVEVPAMASPSDRAALVCWTGGSWR